jgi:tRNA-dihydrouridine synthase
MKERKRKCYSKKDLLNSTILGKIREAEFSDEVLDIWISTIRHFKSKYAALKKFIHSLIKTRNHIFEILKELQELRDTSKISMVKKKDDYLKIAEASRTLRNIDQIKVLDLWGIKRKTEGKDL